MAYVMAIVLTLFFVSVIQAQRPWYAGVRPIGYPELADRFQDPDNRPAFENNFDGSILGNRFGESEVTERIPVDALGDRYLVEMISRWPVDKQPFWFINSAQIEAQRGGTPPGWVSGTYVPLNRPVQSDDTGFLSG